MSAVSIRPLKTSDRDAFLDMVHRSRELHRPWAYPPERADQFDELLSRCSRDDFACFLVIDDDTGEIAGVFNISQIVRGSFQSAFLGYYGSARHAGRGLMRRRAPGRPRLRVRPARAAPHRGEHPARQRRLDRARPRRRLPPRGLLAALPADRRPVARPRALRADGRRAQQVRRRGSEQPELRLGRLLLRSRLDLLDQLRLLDDRLGLRRLRAAAAGRARAGPGGGRSRRAACRAASACRARRPGGRSGTAGRRAGR